MASKESKYERVETVNVDAAGNTSLKDVREDRGSEDPGMNFQDKRPANLVPGAQAGLVPNSSSSSSHSSGFVEPSLSRGAAGEYSASSHHHSSSSHTGSGVGAGMVGAAAASKLAGSGHSSTHSSHHSSSQRSADAGYGSTGVGSTGTTGVTTQRTTVVTTDTVQGLGQQRTVPIQPHTQREQHEVIQHESQTRAPETTVITIPTTRFESAKMESTRSGVTYTDDKQLTIPAPVVAPQIHAHQAVDLGAGTHAEITATTNMHMASEAQIKDMGPEEYARYRQKVEQLARQHEQETSQKAATYRTQVEKDAELIRQTLERQHIRDIEFRKDMVESSVDRQQTEIQLEAEYAMRALEQERAAARAALDQAKMSTNIDVNIDSAIGTTHSQGKVTTTSETRREETKGPSSATRI